MMKYILTVIFWIVVIYRNTADLFENVAIQIALNRGTFDPIFSQPNGESASNLLT